jgi:hypothetical protein
MVYDVDVGCLCGDCSNVDFVSEHEPLNAEFSGCWTLSK